MDHALRSSQLVPNGFGVERTALADDPVRIWVRAASSTGLCPTCAAASQCAHSRSLRRQSDFPLSGRLDSLHLTVRLLRWDVVVCGQHVFAERFPIMFWKAETITLAATEEGVRSLVMTRSAIVSIQIMIRTKTAADLQPWLQIACTSFIVSFARGIINDEKAVRAVMTLLWSNGQSEGQITKLKLAKRQKYGRGKTELLQAKLIGAP